MIHRVTTVSWNYFENVYNEKMGAGAASYRLLIEQGANLSIAMVIKDGTGIAIDITGYTFRGEIRATYSDPTVISNFTFVITDGPSGKVTMSLTAVQTAAIAADPAINYKKMETYLAYDVEMVDLNSFVTRLIQGVVDLSPEVTR